MARPFFPKWEFWPLWLFYIPVYFYVIFLALKARSSSFFSLSNPIMKWGGLFSYSKFKILRLLPDQYLPDQLFIARKTSSNEALELCEQNSINFPLILKPDLGERGKAVAYIENSKGFHDYPFWNKSDIIIQEYIDWPLEIGLLWVRDMHSKQGFISSLMERSLLKVKGNGKDNIYQLLIKDSRFRRYADNFKSLYPKKSTFIPAQKVSVIVEPIGNHSRGTIFLNAMNQIDENLKRHMNELLTPVVNFNYGRLDIRAKSWEDLKQGKNFKILEINGANSEPAHIYQPGASILKAYKTLFQHWKYIYKIAKYNSKNGMKSESLGQLYRAYKEYLNID